VGKKVKQIETYSCSLLLDEKMKRTLWNNNVLVGNAESSYPYQDNQIGRKATKLWTGNYPQTLETQIEFRDRNFIYRYLVSYHRC